jgi:CubicO group peptidase (beta-lactamase class C family)
MPKSRIHIWLTPVLVVAGLLLLGIPGLWVYVSITAKPLHPSPQAAPSVTGSTPLPKWTGAVEEARQIVREGLAEQNLPGLSVAVGIGSDLVWAEGFGFADLDNRVPVTPNHRFRIGTASTVLTSAAAGLLLEKGRLKLDEKIQTYVREFPEKQWPVSVRQVMGHVAGIINDGGDESTLYSEHCERPVEALPHFAKSPLLFEPGTRYRFSTHSWILMSAAIEAAADQPFLAFMREQVFEPLGMRDTLAESATTQIPDRVSFYFPRFAAKPTYGLHPMRPLDFSCYAGSSVFLSTPSDLARFGMAINGGKLLRRDTVKLLQTSQQLSSGAETGYGLGWDLETVPVAGKQARVAGHDGNLLGGMAASLVTLPEYAIVVAATSNISYADTFSLATRIAQAFEGPPENPAVK